MKEKIISIIKTKSFIQLIKYGFIGIGGLLVDIGIYLSLAWWLKVNPEFANLVSTTCGLINNFFWNSYTNFKVYDHLWRRFIDYYLIGQITTLMTTLSIFIFVTILGENKITVKIIATFVATLVQFGINKTITFKRR